MVTPIVGGIRFLAELSGVDKADIYIAFLRY